MTNEGVENPIILRKNILNKTRVEPASLSKM
jgi:hypothetical protein